MNNRNLEETSKKVSKWLNDPMTSFVLDHCEAFARQRKVETPTESLVASMFACAALSCKHDGRLEMLNYIYTLPQSLVPPEQVDEEPSYTQEDDIAKELGKTSPF